MKRHARAHGLALYVGPSQAERVHEIHHRLRLTLDPMLGVIGLERRIPVIERVNRIYVEVARQAHDVPAEHFGAAANPMN